MRQIFKTTLLMTVLTALFMAVGYMIGGRSGMLLALGVAAVSNVVTYFFSDSIVLKMQGAQQLTRSEERRVGKECRSRWSP